MAESMKGWKRSHRCGELGTGNVGEEVTVMGWVQKQRNKAGLFLLICGTVLEFYRSFLKRGTAVRKLLPRRRRCAVNL